MYDQLPQSRRDDVMRAVYCGRVCEPDEVAAAVLWLGSACPEYVNGTTLDVNNGKYPREIYRQLVILPAAVLRSE